MKYELLQDFIAQRRQEIFEEGKALANSFYLASEAALSEKSSSRRTKVGTRVRMIGNSLVCEWYWRRLANPIINGKRQTKIFSTYIRIGKNGRYSTGRFKSEPQWARIMIEQIEARYVVLRGISKELTNLEQSLKRLMDSDNPR